MPRPLVCNIPPAYTGRDARCREPATVFGSGYADAMPGGRGCTSCAAAYYARRRASEAETPRRAAARAEVLEAEAQAAEQAEAEAAAPAADPPAELE